MSDLLCGKSLILNVLITIFSKLGFVDDYKDLKFPLQGFKPEGVRELPRIGVRWD